MSAMVSAMQSNALVLSHESVKRLSILAPSSKKKNRLGNLPHHILWLRIWFPNTRPPPASNEQ